MWKFFDATIFLDEVPEIDYCDGLFFISVRYGENVIRRCYKPHIFLRAKQLGDAAIAKWQSEQRGQVAELRPQKKLPTR